MLPPIVMSLFTLTVKKPVKYHSVFSFYWAFLSFYRLTYSKMEEYALACESYEKALELDPDNDGYKKNLGLAKEKSTVSWSMDDADSSAK